MTASAEDLPSGLADTATFCGALGWLEALLGGLLLAIVVEAAVPGRGGVLMLSLPLVCGVLLIACAVGIRRGRIAFVLVALVLVSLHLLAVCLLAFTVVAAAPRGSSVWVILPLPALFTSVYAATMIVLLARDVQALRRIRRRARRGFEPILSAAAAASRNEGGSDGQSDPR